jgi:Zn-finger protein
MTILKGLERCKYISDILDESDYLVWSKDMNGNLLFVNKKAFNVFKQLNKNGFISCPFNITENVENIDCKIEIDGREVWVRYSSEILYKKNEYNILIVAKDVTEEKMKEKEIEKILDQKISDWQKEEQERSARIDKSNKEVFKILNFIKGEVDES